MVLPVSLLGMTVGALIAASVPRYYVASTDVHFNAEHLLKESDKYLADPLAESLTSARPLIEAEVPEVLRQLGWQEALVDDRDAQAQFVTQVASRVSVNDRGTERRNRLYTDLRITYRDTDGERAATFTNALRDQWIKRQLGELERRGNEELQRVQEQRTLAQEFVSGVAREVMRYESVHKLDPGLRNQNLMVVGNSLAAQLQEDRRYLDVQLLQLGPLNSEIESLRQQLEGQIKPLIEAPPPVIDELLALDLRELQLQIRGIELRLNRVFNEGTPEYETLSKQRAALKEELKAKTPVVERALIPNPLFIELQRRVDSLLGQRRALQGTIDTLRQRIDGLEDQLEKRPRIMQDYDEKLKHLEKAYARLNAIDANLSTVGERVSLVRASKPFDVLRPAQRPPRPTEPNIAILGLLGSLIGLGAAIGLIFALDALRFTYKTIDELERGLPVPVLGGISHVETQIERTQTRRGRVWGSVVAMLLVFLIVAVATLYYVAPARLPTWARDMLDLVLGTGE